jgi:hypothetical protein
MVTDKLSENQACTKAMAAIEQRFQGRTSVITQAEFQAISDYIETLEHEVRMLSAENHSLLSQNIQPEDFVMDSREALDKHLDTCPECGGVADNGYDRSWPEPNPYLCTKCQEEL